MELTMAKAINLALHDAMTADDSVLCYGEDIGSLGGVFRVTENLLETFGCERVVDSPLSESGLVGTAIGMAMRGLRPVVELQFDGFVFPAFDQITQQLAKFHFRSHGRINLPIVIRFPYGGGIGSVENHSESIEAYFVHTPGLTVVTPSNPHDAYWMMRQAISSPDPVIFMEPKRRYHRKGVLDREAAGIELHRARLVRQGTDVSLLAWGPMVATCAEAAEAAVGEGHDIQIIDVRSLRPLDLVTITQAVKSTTRAIIVHEATRTFGPGAELAAQLGEDLFYVMNAPVLRVTGYDTPYPPSKLEGEWLPNVDRILDAIDDSLNF